MGGAVEWWIESALAGGGCVVDKINVTLEGMGSTPEQVAEAVRRERVLGLRDSTSYMNPIVRYLNRKLDIGGKLEVGAAGTILRLHLQGRPQEATLPIAVQVFLEGFHRGLYPDLEEK
jgi:hypothetical protein